MKVIVCGSRSFRDRKRLFAKLDALTANLAKVVVVTGACPEGADRYAEEWAYSKKYTVERHHADWDRHGKAAGPVRNGDMAKCGAKACIAFWDGQSPGTADMIAKAKRAKLKVKVYYF